jgi:uncharacterized protein
METTLPVTGFFAALNASLLIVLTIRVANFRRMNRISAGDAGDKGFGRRIQAHTNAVEQIPITLILMALAEGLSTSPWLIATAGGLLTIGRVCHACQFSLPRVPLAFRATGMILGFSAQIIAIVSILYLLAFA